MNVNETNIAADTVSTLDMTEIPVNYFYDVFRWAKAEEFDPSAESFLKVVDVYYGTRGETINWRDVFHHVTKILEYLQKDYRFGFGFNQLNLMALMIAPYQEKAASERMLYPKPDTTTVDFEEYVRGLVQFMANVIRNSPTGRLKLEDFTIKKSSNAFLLCKFVREKGGGVDAQLVHTLITRITLASGEDRDVYRLPKLVDWVINAGLEAYADPKFGLPTKTPEELLKRWMMHPLSSKTNGLNLGFSPRYSDLRRVDEVYYAMLRCVLSDLWSVDLSMFVTGYDRGVL